MRTVLPFWRYFSSMASNDATVEESKIWDSDRSMTTFCGSPA